MNVLIFIGVLFLACAAYGAHQGNVLGMMGWVVSLILWMLLCLITIDYMNIKK